ncbi:MAG: RND family transporter, partial [Halanaerobiales bacterium]
MRKYVEFIETNRKLLYVLLIILILLAAVGIRRIDIDTDFTLFMPGTSEYKEVLEEMNDTFTTSEQLTILLEGEESGLTLSLLRDYRDLQQYLTDLGTTEYVNGPAPANLNLGQVRVNFADLGEQDLGKVEGYYGELADLSPVIYHEGNTYGIFTVFPADNFGLEEINRIESYLEDRGLSYYLTGDVYMQHKIIDYITSILIFIPPLAILLLV